MTTRFSMFTDEELDSMEEAFCNEGLKHLVDELRRERRYRENRKEVSRDEDKLIDLANAIESDDSGYWTNKRISSALRNI